MYSEKMRKHFVCQTKTYSEKKEEKIKSKWTHADPHGRVSRSGSLLKVDIFMTRVVKCHMV